MIIVEKVLPVNLCVNTYILYGQFLLPTVAVSKGGRQSSHISISSGSTVVILFMHCLKKLTVNIQPM